MVLNKRIHFTMIAMDIKKKGNSILILWSVINLHLFQQLKMNSLYMYLHKFLVPGVEV